MSKERIYKPTIPPEALINKIRRPGKEENLDINMSDLYSTVNEVGEINASNKEVVDLLPDIQVAKETLVSSIVGGLNMFGTNLTYKIDDSELDASSKSAMLKMTEKHINKIYKMNDKLYKMTEEALFDNGAYCDIIIPENVLSSMLHSKLTTDVEELNVIENNSVNVTKLQVSYKEKLEDLNISIGDNLALIRRDVIVEEEVTEDTESIDEVKDIKKLFLTSKVKRGDVDTISLDTIDDVKREALGLPLVFNVPVESIIPISSHDPSNHIKYILMLDEYGNPMKYNAEEVSLKGATDKEIIEQALATEKSKDTTKKVSIPNKVIYDTISKSILKRVNNDTIHKVTPEMLNTVYYLAFTNYLAESKVRFIILEPENVNYLAFDYRNNGTGRSMLEKLGPLVSMRAILLMTRMNANIDNSITKFKVTADLDPKDPKYKRTAGNIVQSAYNSRSSNMLFNVRNLDTLNSLISRAGIYFQINHPKMPNMNMDFENINSDKREPDTDFYDSLKKDTLKVFGLTPEMVEDAASHNLATEFKIKSSLFSRRIGPKRKVLSMFVTSYVKKAIRNDKLLYSRLENYIRENLSTIIKLSPMEKDDKSELKKYSEDNIVTFFLEEFISDIVTYLPEEEPNEDNVLNNAFSSYKDRLEEYLDTMFSPEALPDEFIGEVGGKLDAIKGAVHNTLMRKWMSDNNYMSEVVNVFDTDDNGIPHNSAAEEFIGYLKKVLESSEILFSKELSKILKQSGKMTSRFDKFMEEPEEPEGGNEDDGDDEPEEGAGSDNTDGTGEGEPAEPEEPEGGAEPEEPTEPEDGIDV